MSHTLPALPYAYDGLEPYISLEALTLHHQKHHQAYVDTLNAAEDQYDQKPTDEQRRVLEAVILFNRGGHENHTLFFQNLAPSASAEKGHGGIINPNGPLSHWLEESFRNIDAMKREFKAKAARIQGAGWCWIAFNPVIKKLEVVTTENEGTLQKHVPIIAVDVWEHAYYLQYKNTRAKYIDAIWNVIDFQEAEKRLMHALDNTPYSLTRSIDSSVTGALLTNTGTLPLTIIDGADTFEVAPEASHIVTTASTDTLVQATGKTVASITYKDSSVCTVARGVQVAGAKFDLKVSMRA